jgi:hypothetical protein
VSVKCEPELAVAHWNTITLDGTLPDQLVRDPDRRLTSSQTRSFTRSEMGVHDPVTASLRLAGVGTAACDCRAE